jgi:hypothetical protein
MADALLRLEKNTTRYEVSKVLVHLSGKSIFPSTALRSGVKLYPVDRLPAAMGMTG